MQGVRFSAAAVEGSAYLLAANGNELYATALKLQSINVENALSKHGSAADASKAASPANRLLNYIHSCCLRFPLDDCIGLAEASQLAQRGEATACRTVRLHIATRAPLTFHLLLGLLRHGQASAVRRFPERPAQPHALAAALQSIVATGCDHACKQGLNACA